MLLGQDEQRHQAHHECFEKLSCPYNLNQQLARSGYVDHIVGGWYEPFFLTHHRNARGQLTSWLLITINVSQWLRVVDVQSPQ